MNTNQPTEENAIEQPIQPTRPRRPRGFMAGVSTLVGVGMTIPALLSGNAGAQPVKGADTEQSTSSTSPESSSTSETTSTVIVDPTSTSEASTTTSKPIIKIGRGTTTTFETPPTIPNVAEQPDNAATQDVLPRTE